MEHKELLLIADAVSQEKGLSRDEVLTSLEEGIETALRKDFPEGATIAVHIDNKTGDIRAYRTFQLVDQIENVELQMLNSEIDDEIVEDGIVFEPFNFVLDRQKFSIAKQVALQKIKQGSRDHQIEDLLDQNINLFNGIVKVAKKEQIIVDCKGLDITLPRRNLLPRDHFKSGEKVYFTLEREKNQYVGTRISDEYLIEVLKHEIVDIEEGKIEIVSIARNPGFRSKIIVKSLVRNLDAVKACVGQRGANIQSVQNFLGGEFIDVLHYNEDPAQLLINAFEPVNVTNIVMDEDTNTMEIAVKDEEISKAIGKGGKNIELISKLVGWNVNVVSQSQWKQNEENSDEKVIATFEAGLSCDREVAEMLVAEGFSSLEEVAYVPRHEFVIEQLNDEIIDELRKNAKDTLSNPVALAKAEGVGELSSLGFTPDDREVLQNNGVYGAKDIADLATYELVEFLPNINEDDACKTIMNARKDDIRFNDATSD